MLDAVMQSLATVAAIFVGLFLSFAIYVAWRIRAELKDLFKALVNVIKSMVGIIKVRWNHDYTRDELVYNIQYFEKRGKKKQADYWRRELGRHDGTSHLNP